MKSIGVNWTTKMLTKSNWIVYNGVEKLIGGDDTIYEFECLTKGNNKNVMDECSPFYGECYPVGEGCCGPDCNPTDGYCEPDVD